MHDFLAHQKQVAIETAERQAAIDNAEVKTNPKTSQGARTSKPATPRPTPRMITLPRPTPIPITVVDTPTTGIGGSKTTSETFPNQDIRRKGTHEQGLNTG